MSIGSHLHLLVCRYTHKNNSRSCKCSSCHIQHDYRANSYLYLRFVLPYIPTTSSCLSGCMPRSLLNCDSVSHVHDLVKNINQKKHIGELKPLKTYKQWKLCNRLWYSPQAPLIKSDRGPSPILVQGKKSCCLQRENCRPAIVLSLKRDFKGTNQSVVP